MDDALSVAGIHARLFDDDAAAAFVDSNDSLVAWSEDSSVLMDRYDVRHLIQDSSLVQQRRHHSSPGQGEITDNELDLERYRDLHEGHEEHEEDNNATPTTSRYSNVPFDYGAENEKNKEREKIDSISIPPSLENNKEETIFVPGFPVPDDLRQHLPATEKLHQIISGTAKFVSERGGQAEIILKVKQADNPKFGFLLPDHVHHPYFRHLVDHPELTGAGLTKSSPPPPPPPPPPPQPGSAFVTKPAEGLRLLGEVYGEDDEEINQPGTLPITVEIRTIKEPPPAIKTVMEKMVEYMIRNGKDFEDVVREGDKSDDRFHFLHPWHEYHPYYLTMLQNADQASLRRRSSFSKQKQTSKQPGNVKTGWSSSPRREANSREIRSARSTRFDVPPSGIQREETVRNVTRGAEESSGNGSSEVEFVRDIVVVDRKEQQQQEQQAGMSYDAALAAVRAATRGIQKPKASAQQDKPPPPPPPKPDIKAERLKRAKMLVKGGGVEEADKQSSQSLRDVKINDRDREDGRSDKKRTHSRKRKHSPPTATEEVSDDVRAKVRAMLQQL